jgi:hypothetical protein
MYHKKNILQSGHNVWHGILLIMNIRKLHEIFIL